jgi:glycosyltransferase involved in cell wall biosynthesis
MNPFFSITTPTLQRESLKECCASVDIQTYTDWEHIVMIDAERVNESMIISCDRANRRFAQCLHPHHNYGNTCRHNAWTITNGVYLLYLDDDNWLFDKHVLGEIADYLLSAPQWAIFPIFRHGSLFFNDPPGLCMTDTANVVVRREIGRWPDMPDYTADGHWVEALKKYPYEAHPDSRPIVMMPKSNEGK